jgi:hypothetical protein
MNIQLFISHSSKDKTIVDSFVDNILKLGIGFSDNAIFCTSSEGMGIKSGEDWREKIKAAFNQAEVIILIITPNYKGSEICQNEMGAAWMSGKLVIPLIADPVTYKSVGVVVETAQIAKLDENGLDQAHESLMNKFPNKKANVNIPVWESKKRKFIRELEAAISSNPFPSTLSQAEILEVLKKLDDIRKEYDKLSDTNDNLRMQINDLEKVKDKAASMEIKKKYLSTDSTLEDFGKLVQDAKSKLEKVTPVVRTIAFNTIYGNNLEVRPNFNNEINLAISKKFIDDEDNALWEKSTMREIKEALTNLNDFIDGLSNDDYQAIADHYQDISIDCSDLDFWLDMLKVRMDYIS